MIGVVIPTLNEANTLPALLEDLRQLGVRVPLDLVVVDGGSSDGTRTTAAAAGAHVVAAPRGRARQLNAGAHAAHGEWLLFLHADCRVTPACQAALAAALGHDDAPEAAVFRFAVDLPPGWKQLLEWGQALRQAAFGLPYGDQGLLVRRRVFERVGGYPEIPIMEDVAIIRHLARLVEIKTLPAALSTSGRRYRTGGVLRTALRHTMLLLLYGAGVSPERLAAWRDPHAQSL